MRSRNSSLVTIRKRGYTPFSDSYLAIALLLGCFSLYILYSRAKRAEAQAKNAEAQARKAEGMASMNYQRAREETKKAEEAKKVEVKINGGKLILTDMPGVIEGSVPVTINDKRVDTGSTPVTGDNLFNLIQVQVQDQSKGASPTILWSDLVANTFVRPTYQKPEGSSAPFGTSVVASPSYRTSEAFRFVPRVTKANLVTISAKPDERLRSEVWLDAVFQSGRRSDSASIRSAHRYLAPASNGTGTFFHLDFEAKEDLVLDPKELGKDAFRLLTLASMYSNKEKFDANVVRYEARTEQGCADPPKKVTLRIGDAMARDAFLLPHRTELGSWFELVKEPGSIRWNPDGPSIHVQDIKFTGMGEKERLGIQGWLSKDTDPCASSLNLWVEWLNAPEVVRSGTKLAVEFLVIAVPPARVRDE